MISSGREQPNRSVLLLHGGGLGDFVLAYHFASQFCPDPPRNLHVIARHPVAKWFARQHLIADARRDDAVRLHEIFVDDPEPSRELTDYLRRFELILNLLGDRDSPVHANLLQCCDAEIVSIDTRADPSSTLHILEQWNQRVPASIQRTVMPRPHRAPRSASSRIHP